MSQGKGMFEAFLMPETHSQLSVVFFSESSRACVCDDWAGQRDDSVASTVWG
jgi:hypothetical protein